MRERQTLVVHLLDYRYWHVLLTCTTSMYCELSTTLSARDAAKPLANALSVADTTTTVCRDGFIGLRLASRMPFLATFNNVAVNVNPGGGLVAP